MYKQNSNLHLDDSVISSIHLLSIFLIFQWLPLSGWLIFSITLTNHMIGWLVNILSSCDCRVWTDSIDSCHKPTDWDLEWEYRTQSDCLWESMFINHPEYSDPLHHSNQYDSFSLIHQYNLEYWSNFQSHFEPILWIWLFCYSVY